MDAYESGATMIDAIALSSPSGRMSKRARKAAMARLGQQLFPNGIPRKLLEPESRLAYCERWAREYRQLAASGMRTRYFTKQADALEAEAAELRGEP